MPGHRTGNDGGASSAGFQGDADRLIRSRRRLASHYAIGMALGLCLVLGVGYWVHSALVKHSLRIELEGLARVEAGVHLPDLQQWAAGTRRQEDVSIGFRPHRTAFYYILSANAELVHGNESRPQLREQVLRLLRDRSLPVGTVVFGKVDDGAGEILRLALLRHPVEQDGDYLGSVYAATDVSGSLAHLEQLFRVVLALALGFVLLASFGGWWMADRSMIPLRRSLERQRRFVADASHELRAPLTVLTTALMLVRDEAGDRLDAFQRETLDDALDETRRLSRLSEELLTLARADSGQLSVCLGRVDLGELVRRCARLRQAEARSRGLWLEHEVVGEAHAHADSDLVVRMIGSALDNALAYTESGGRVKLGVCHEGGSVLLVVEDTGIGMDCTELEQVFERFYRADPARQRSRAGAGLGLSLIRELAQAQGAQVQLASSPGVGTTVSIRFRAFS